VTRKWVLNASPTILLAKISLIDLVVSELCSTVIIPSGVVQEIKAGPANDPAKIWLAQTGKKWITEMTHIEPTVAA